MWLLAATFSQDCLGVSLKHTESNEPLDVVSASKHALWSSSRASPPGRDSVDSDNDDEDSEGIEAVLEQTVATGAGFVKAANAELMENYGNSGFMKAATEELGQISTASAAISAASAAKLGDLYVKVNSTVDREFLHKLYYRPMGGAYWGVPHGMMHKLHINGQLYYPHMHVANHRIVKPELKPHLDPSVAAFVGSQSMMDDRVSLALVCLVLIALSAFFNMYRSADKSLPVCHGDAAAASGELLSVWDGTIATFSSILGMGFLSLPYCMSLAGWIAAPLMIFFTSCGCYTAHLLTWAMRQEMVKANRQGKTPMPGWGFLLLSAYGPSAERFMNMFLVIELWGYVLSGIVATAMNLNMLVDEISVSSAVCLTVLLQFLLSNAPGKLLTQLNLVCNALFIGCCFMFIITGLLLPKKVPVSELRYVKPEGLLAACGIIVFSPCSHSLYPSIMQRMEEPDKYPSCIRRAYVLACIAYLSLAVPGYYLFGDAVQPSAVTNIGADLNLVALPNLGWMNSVAAFCMVMKLAGLQPLILTPLNSTIECMLQGWAPKSIIGTLVPPSVLTVSAIVAMHFAHQMGTLLNLVGSIFCMTIALVLPVLCYWRLRPGIPCLQQVLFSGLVVMGGTFAVLGLLTAIDS